LFTQQVLVWRSQQFDWFAGGATQEFAQSASAEH
jgi:hypothetical protein